MNIDTIKIQTNIEENMINFAQQIKEPFSKASILIDNLWINNSDEVQNVFGNMLANIKPLYDSVDFKGISDSLVNLKRAFGNYNLLYFTTNKSDEENVNEEKANIKIIGEIFDSNQANDISRNGTATITLSPVNDKVLKYLSENPQAFYQLTAKEFEIVMAEIYNKLGYDVELTKATRDGGKDIIIRKPEILGDFIYYVECKKNAPKRHIGVGIMKNLIATVNMDKVNGGILATTSYFTKDAKELIINNNLDYQIKMHDFAAIKDLLNQVI